ncbi:phage replisome organizer N-terminal domain-containing protein [Weissella paramesenteroides]|uniref:phage replisome organizer N-terminal domain-containing protein n=1 Tax=Weissella paramesenteroides TaxID=1249 RepID=UPI00223C4B27|nr:phage replisome organizer N-terminal domain-containing protein [Weissella paramesenteroides]MDF8367073.1 DnaD domain protein [Weissella paramesenteroides]MDF8373617.1 DnaD domain protein [Weissella paramesenteroides]WEA52326.1 phage replisome organizer N-terminal domain-containing protein [Weissella paramesenteroides]WIG66602.1 DnaD domain protein [Weissella paramesenteroides]
MSDKRYFWLKLPENFFSRKEIKALRRIAGGDTYTVIYLKMLLKSLQTDGKLYFEGVSSNFIEEIALDIDEEYENVQVTVNYLHNKGLLVDSGTDEVELVSMKNMVGSESSSTERKRRQRERERQLVSSKTNNRDNVTPKSRLGHVEKEIEIDKELDIETEREQETENNQSSVVTPAKTQLLNSLQDNGIFISPNSVAFDNLIAFHEQDGMEIGVLLKAIGVASAAGKNSVSYINGILNNKLSKNILTLEQYEKDEKNWQDNQSNRQAESDLTPEQVKWLADRQRKRERNATS